jgi:hypothetical protein
VEQTCDSATSVIVGAALSRSDVIWVIALSARSAVVVQCPVLCLRTSISSVPVVLSERTERNSFAERCRPLRLQLRSVPATVAHVCLRKKFHPSFGFCSGFRRGRRRWRMQTVRRRRTLPAAVQLFFSLQPEGRHKTADGYSTFNASLSYLLPLVDRLFAYPQLGKSRTSGANGRPLLARNAAPRALGFTATLAARFCRLLKEQDRLPPFELTGSNVRMLLGVSELKCSGICSPRVWGSLPRCVGSSSIMY